MDHLLNVYANQATLDPLVLFVSFPLLSSLHFSVSFAYPPLIPLPTLCLFIFPFSKTKATTPLVSQTVISSQSIMPNNWAYYYFSSTSTAVSITLVETSSSGKLMLIVSLDRYPSGENYEYYDIGPSNFHEVHIVWGSPSARVYYAGVTTSTVTMNTDPITYSITGWSFSFSFPPFFPPSPFI